MGPLLIIGLFVAGLIGYCLIGILALMFVGVSDTFLTWLGNVLVPRDKRRSEGNNEGLLGVGLIVGFFWPLLLPLTVLFVFIGTLWSLPGVVKNWWKYHHKVA